MVEDNEKKVEKKKIINREEIVESRKHIILEVVEPEQENPLLKDQVKLDKGIFSCLKLCQQNGDLKKKVNRSNKRQELIVGRNNDAKIKYSDDNGKHHYYK